jgi:hypothetical protein
MRHIWLVLAIGACGGGSESSCPAFATVTGGTFARAGTDLTWTLAVESIGTLTFNKAPANVLEYRWGVDLDSTRDGVADLRVAANYFVRDGQAEMMTADVLSMTQEDVWRVEPSGAAIAVGSVTVTQAGNTFTFVTNDREDAALAGVTDASQSTWIASWFEDLENNCEDTFEP